MQNLYKLRNKMINVKDNFNSSHTNKKWCKTCFLFSETKQHLVDCPPIRQKLKGLVKFENLTYNMIFGSTKNQEIFAKNYTLVLNARQDIIDMANDWVWQKVQKLKENTPLPLHYWGQQHEKSDARDTTNSFCIVSFWIKYR